MKTTRLPAATLAAALAVTAAATTMPAVQADEHGGHPEMVAYEPPPAPQTQDTDGDADAQERWYYGGWPPVQTPEFGSPAGDYATDVFGDPFDYRNPEDLLLDVGPNLNVSRPVFADEALHFSVDAGKPGYISPLWMTWPGAIAGTPRDGTMAPIDASTYDTVALWAWADQTAAASIDWFACQKYDISCLGGAGFQLKPGWHRYEVHLPKEPSPSREVGWSGDILGMRLAIGAPDQGVNVKVHSLQIVDRSEAALEIVFEHDRANMIEIWPTDHPDRMVAVPAEMISHEGGIAMRAILPEGALPPDDYQYRPANYGASGGGAYGDTFDLTIGGPEPRVLQPDAAGDTDRAYSRRAGRAWDMNTPASVLAVRNASDVSFSGGVLHGTNAPPQQNDPYVLLPLAAGAIDSRTYRNLTVTHTYDGSFGLQDGDGGGMHGRLLWKHPTNPAWVDGREIVKWTDRDTYTVDLHTNQLDGNQDHDNVRKAGWRTGPVTALRYDLNEDRGRRRWHLHDVMLTPDDTASASGRFPVEWVDDNHTPGTTVDIHVGRRPGASDTVAVAEGIQQQAGTNRRTVDLSRVGGGLYFVKIISTRPDGSKSSVWSTGPVDVRRRVAGADRIETAIEMAQMAGRYDTAVLATARGWADAATGTALAAAAGGPLLLTDPGGLDDRVANELDRARTSHVYVLGGTAALDQDVDRQLRRLGTDVTRLAGPDRYATAAAIADQTVALLQADGHTNAGKHPVVVSGQDFPDALTAGPLAATTHQPMLLVATDHVPDPTDDRLDVDDVTVVGGPVAIADTVVDTLRRRGTAVDRVAGSDRYATATAIADRVTGGRRADVLLSTGLGWADALAGGALMADRGGVVLLTDPHTLSPATAGWLDAHRPAWLNVAGGPVAVDDTTIWQAEDTARCARGC